MISNEGWICPNCGKVISPFMVFCPFCDNAKEADTPKRRRKKKEPEPLKLDVDIMDEWFNGEKK